MFWLYKDKSAARRAIKAIKTGVQVLVDQPKIEHLVEGMD